MAHIFGTYWVFIFLNNFNDYVTTAITLNYFFQNDDVSEISNIRIFCHVLTHNIGTIAWSIILLPTLILKTIFGVFDNMLSGRQGGFARCVDAILCPCCWCYESFVDRFDENYFATSYLGSENFWTATTRIYYLKEKYGQRDEVSRAGTIGLLINFVSKIFISFFTLWCGKMIYDSKLEMQQNIDYPGVIFFFVFLIGFIVGSLFINIFATTYDTLLTCYLIQQNLREFH